MMSVCLGPSCAVEVEAPRRFCDTCMTFTSRVVRCGLRRAWREHDHELVEAFTVEAIRQIELARGPLVALARLLDE